MQALKTRFSSGVISARSYYLHANIILLAKTRHAPNVTNQLEGKSFIHIVQALGGRTMAS